MLLQSGELFANRFEIERAAGFGGMGTVYRATDRFSGAPVALKLLNFHALQSGAQHELQRFDREAELLSELRHPGIVSYIAHGQAPDGQRFLAMEWLDGHDLAQHLRRGPLALRDALLILKGVAAALAFIHRRGVVHRDIKPSNLFLTNGDLQQVKLLDFGIARRLAAPRAMTRTGLVIGTPEYMAPEQVRGVRELTPAADIFSLGCVLYECLTGEPPFVAAHVAAVLVRILFEEPPPLSTHRPGLPESLVSLVRRMLHKDVAQRIPDTTELLRHLAELGEVPELTTQPTLAAPARSPSTFAEREQALFSLVVAASPREDNVLDVTLPAGTPRQSDRERRAALLNAVRGLGAHAEFLLDGALVATLPQTGSATDQAAMAARVALLIKDRWPEAGVAVSTGLGAAPGSVPIGEIADRAAQLLARHSRGGGSAAQVDAQSGVWLDDLSARLLGAPFILIQAAEGMLLLGEEKQADESRPLLGKPTPCVGRDAELAALEGQLHSCIEDEEGRAVLVTAPPGVGKSRLRHEFLRRLDGRSEPITVLLGRGDLLSAGAAYGIFARAIVKLCALSGSEPPETMREHLRQRIGRYVPEPDRARITAYMGELCGMPFPETEFPFLGAARQDVKSLPERVQRAALDWLAAECRAAPVIIVLDDLHWGDELSVALLDEALRSLRSAPLFVLALARPEVHATFPRLGHGSNLQEIALKGLSKRACGRLIQQVLREQATPDAVAWIVEQSAGNALFLEELIRAVADGKTGSEPETVIAMLQARIGRLPVGPRRAVLAAAVYGQSFWEGGVARILGVPDLDPELGESMRVLCESEIIEAHPSSRIPEQREYGFRHALVRDAAYGLLEKGDQRLGHKCAAEFLQATDKQVASALLAYHFHQADAFEPALRHYLTAGERASQQGLYGESRLHYAEADAVIRQLPGTPELYRLHIDLLLKRVNSGMTLLSAESQLALLDSAQALLQRLFAPEVEEPQDRLLRARLEFYYARIYLYGGQTARAMPYFHRVLPVAREFEDEELLALTCQVLGMAELTHGQIKKALAIMAPLLGPAGQRFGLSLEGMRCLMYPAVVFAVNGQFERASTLAQKANDLALQSQQPALRGVVQMLEALCHIAAARWHDAIAASQDALLFCKQSGQTLQQYMALDSLAYAQSKLGLHEPALRNRAESAALRQGLGGSITEDWFEALEAEILLNAGRVAESLAKASHLAVTSKAAGRLFSYPVAERVWGCALARCGAELADVEAHLRAALESCEETGYVTEIIQCELWWGLIYRERGDPRLAQQHFEQALKRLEVSGGEKGLAWARAIAGGT